MVLCPSLGLSEIKKNLDKMVDVSGSFFFLAHVKMELFLNCHFQAHKHKKHKQHEWQEDGATQ